jgi:hypothetical protein
MGCFKSRTADWLLCCSADFFFLLNLLEDFGLQLRGFVEHGAYQYAKVHCGLTRGIHMRGVARQLRQIPTKCGAFLWGSLAPLTASPQMRPQALSTQHLLNSDRHYDLHQSLCLLNPDVGYFSRCLHSVACMQVANA